MRTSISSEWFMHVKTRRAYQFIFGDESFADFFFITSFFLPLQMALDAKAIKEEIPDKDVYESSARRPKGKRIYTFYWELQSILSQTYKLN